MRERIFGLVAVLAWGLQAPAAHATDAHGAAGLPKTADINLPYPDLIDLQQEPSGWTFRLNQNEQPLYMSTADPPGKSACKGSCAKQWLPVIAQDSSKPLGDWTIVVRDDGKRQWAFKDHPVYTRVSTGGDKPDKKAADKSVNASGSFRLMPHFH